MISTGKKMDYVLRFKKTWMLLPKAVRRHLICYFCDQQINEFRCMKLLVAKHNPKYVFTPKGINIWNVMHPQTYTQFAHKFCWLLQRSGFRNDS